MLPGILAFWEAFFPNFVATVFGVAMGLPVALYVNKRLTIHQYRREDLVAANKFGEVTDVLVRSLNYNKKVLRSISELCKTAQVMRNPDLQLTTWGAIGNSFSSMCPDPEIIQLLSHHWLRLNRLSVMNKEMFDRCVGDLPEITDQEMYLKMWGGCISFPMIYFFMWIA